MLSQLNLVEIFENILEEQYDSILKASKKWSEGMYQYSKDVEPTTTSSLSASEKLELNLNEAFNSNKKNVKTKEALLDSNCSADMEYAFLEFASDLSLGMNKAYISTPPTTLIGFENLFTLPHPKTYKEVAQRLTTAIDNWMKTGTVTLVSTGAIINWS